MKKFNLILIIAILLALPSLAHATVWSVGAYNHTNMSVAEVDKAEGDTNYGPNGIQGVGRILLTPTSGAVTRRGLIMLNLSDFPAGITADDIIHANVTIFVNVIDSANVVSIYRINTSWNQNTVTWNNQPCGGLTALNDTKCNATAEDGISIGIVNTNYTFNITSMFKRALSRNEKNVSFYVRNNEEAGTTNNIEFLSTTTADQSKAPTFYVEYTSTSPDTTLPIGNATLNISTIRINNVVNSTINITDETGLQTANLTINFSAGKRFSNYTISGTSVQLSNVTAITESRGNALNFSWRISDTSGNIRQNDTVITIADTLGSILIGINNTSPKINEVINVSGNATDIDADFSIGVIAYNSSGNPQVNSSFTPVAGYTLFNFSQAVTITLPRGNVYNFTVYSNDTAGTKFQASSLLTIINTPASSPTSLTWVTTGNFTSGTRTYGEIIDWVNATCVADADNDIKSCNLTVTDPDGSIIVNNASMSLINSNIYSYATDFTLNKAGTWTLRVDANDGNSVNSASTTITVQSQNLTIIDGWYGYTNNSLLTENQISEITSSDVTLIELQINATQLSNSFAQILTSTNFSHSKNLKIGINILLDFGLNSSNEKNNLNNNLTANFSKLATDPYQDAIKYISIELPANYSSYSIGDIIGELNNVSKNITSLTSNRFIIYSKIPYTGLDNSYILNTTLKYISPLTHSEWINDENGYMRNTTSLNRIYKVNGSILADINNFHKNVFNTMRGTPVPTTTVGNHTAIELSNGDFLVFNNDSTSRLYYLNFSNVTNILGKDIWDTTNKIYIHSNTNGTANINVSGYSATLIYAEDYDHIEGTWKLYKATSSGQKTFNYTTSDSNGGNFALDVFSNKFKVELFDPHYSINTFITYYGWFNASYINNWSVYSIVIFDDENPHELARILANTTSTDFYGYISVADYTNTGAWQAGKRTEIDNIIALNNSVRLHVFIDGLDTGIGGTNFSTQFRDLTDYVKLTKGRKVGLNTYTAYQTYCGMSSPNGFCMKESCVRRWNGTSASAPTAYDWEDWGLEINKSIWYQAHNVQVLCQAFDNRTMDTNEIYNNTRMQDIYFASKVLGYTDFYESSPEFNYAHTEYVYNVGTSLANSFSTDDNQTYYRRYSNGISYYNSSSHHGWFDDGRTQDVQACFKLYDNSDGAGDEEKDFQFSVNNMTYDNVARNQYTIPATSITAGIWQWYCVKLNETHKSTTGSYKIEGSTSNAGQPADGIYLGWENNVYTGVHSWWSNIAGSAVWNAYPLNQNWEVKIIVNETKKTLTDTFTTGVSQIETTVGGMTNITFTSSNPFDLEVWGNGVTVSRFINLTYWNGTEFARVYPINTSTCNSNNPTWNTTTIGGESHKSCIETIDTNTFVRVATPHLSTQTYQIATNTVPVVNIIQPAENTLYKIQPLDINFTVTDADGQIPTQINIYINGTLNQTLTSVTNTTLNASDGKYNISISAFDGTDWGLNTTVLSFKIDTVTPSSSGLPANSTFNNSNFNATAIFTDNNLYGVNCTIRNGTSLNDKFLFSQEFTNIASTTQNILLEYNTSWTDGEKLTVCRASDDHTKKEQGDIEYDIDKLFVTDRVTFKKGANLQEDVTFDCDEDTTDLKVYKLEDRYSLLFDFSTKKTKGVSNTYTCNLKTNSKITYRQNSNYQAHFVLGKGIGENFVDYVFKGNADAIYTVSQKPFGYQVIINTKENVLNFSSIGGVNILETNTTIIIDSNVPVINTFNLTGKLNNTFYNYANISITMNVTDMFLDNITIFQNNLSNKTIYAVNGSNKIVINLTTDGNYTIVGQAKDKAGNHVNSSYFYNVVIDTIIPSFINPKNLTLAGSNIIYTNTDVNISVNLSDIYIDRGNFSENCTMTNRSWINHSISISGNNTYYNILGSANFTANQVCGWKFYAYDLAGNELDPIYTFTIGSVPSIPSSGSSDSGSMGVEQQNQEGIAIISPPAQIQHNPIEAFVPQIWGIGKETAIQLAFYLNNTPHDPQTINFEFQPDKNNIIYENLTKITTGNYTAFFFVAGSSDEGYYNLTIKSIGSPESTISVPFEIKKDTVAAFISQRKEDVLKITQKVTGTNKDSLTGWQIGMALGGIVFIILILVMMGVIIAKISARKKVSPKKYNY